MQSQRQFKDLLRLAVKDIVRHQQVSMREAKEMLASVTDRSVGTIEKWQQGAVRPPYLKDVKHLAQEIVRLTNADSAWVQTFLMCWGGSEAEATILVQQIFGMLHTRYLPLHIEPFVSPFIDGLPISHPKQFFGHSTLIQRILDLLDPQISQMQTPRIVGAKRSGKSSLLRQLFMLHSADPRQLRPDQRKQRRSHMVAFRWVYIDFQNPLHQQPTDFLNILLDAVGCSIEVDTPSSFVRLFEKSVHEPTILMLDELEVVYERDDFNPIWGSLRYLAGHKRDFSIVIATQDTLQEQADNHGQPSPFFNIFAEYALRPLSVNAAEALIKGSGGFDSADIAWIIEKSRRWPALLQCLCRIRLEALHNHTGEGWKERGERALQSSKYRFLT